MAQAMDERNEHQAFDKESGHHRCTASERITLWTAEAEPLLILSVSRMAQLR
jgi:hypothetical protein